jgi:ABC-2 type transport system ATP-binding protein
VTAAPVQGSADRSTALARRSEAGPAVAVVDIRKRYAGREVLRGVSFEIARGELFALLGPNGAGKTTTVEIIEGYRVADAGEVRVLGLDPRRDGRQLRARLGLMLQEGGIDPRTSPAEALRLYARLFRAPADPDRLLDLVGLDEVAGTRYRRLSVGERQRLGFALALIGRPELLVLDEPTAGMDPAARAATRELIAALRDQGTTILLTTHDLTDVERLADTVAVLDRGAIVALGSPTELTAGAVPRLRFRLAAPLDDAGRRDVERHLLDAQLSSPAGRLVDEGLPGAYRLEDVDPTPGLLATLAVYCARRDLLLVETRVTGGSLEERYLELVGRSVAAEPEHAPRLRR